MLGLTLSSQWGRPCLPPPPLPGQSLWSLRRGAGAPTGRVRPAPSQKPGGRAGRLLCSGARREARDWLWVPCRGGAGGWLLSFPSSGPPLGSISVSSGGAETGANWAQPAVPAWTTLGNRKWEGCTQQVRARLKGTAGAGV